MSQTPAQLLRRALDVLGYTQNQLAPLVGRSQQALSRMVRGKTADPLVVEKVDWLIARHGALVALDNYHSTIDWCVASYKMDPPAFLDHLPWCSECQAMTMKKAGYTG